MAHRDGNTYGHSRIRELILGSTTTTMVGTSPVSVLMFR